ncbi:hypothetical protein V6Z12_A10G202000 [Gossypium hirsutum]
MLSICNILTIVSIFTLKSDVAQIISLNTNVSSTSLPLLINPSMNIIHAFEKKIKIKTTECNAKTQRKGKRKVSLSCLVLFLFVLIFFVAIRKVALRRINREVMRCESD